MKKDRKPIRKGLECGLFAKYEILIHKYKKCRILPHQLRDIDLKRPGEVPVSSLKTVPKRL